MTATFPCNLPIVHFLSAGRLVLSLYFRCGPSHQAPVAMHSIGIPDRSAFATKLRRTWAALRQTRFTFRKGGAETLSRPVLGLGSDTLPGARGGRATTCPNEQACPADVAW